MIRVHQAKKNILGREERVYKAERDVRVCRHENKGQFERQDTRFRNISKVV